MARLKNRNVTALAVAVEGDAPPREFRIFTAGKVETSKGTFIFDAKAAESVLAHYAEQGNELMVDYDHASISFSLDPAQAGKAAGWFNVELRGGELWAVNVRWTEPAAAALSRKEWRYMSPAFVTDEDGRILELINVALTNIPATKKLQPLMAAHAIEALGGTMDPEMVKKALQAIKDGDSDAALALLESMVANAAGAGEEAPPEEPPAEMADDPPVEEEEEEQLAEDEDAPAVAAATARLLRLTGKETFSSALDEIETWRQSHINLSKREAQLAKDRAAIEASDRRRLYGELVTKANKAPATVWADAKAKKAKPYLERMTLAELSQYVDDESAAVPQGARKDLRTPSVRKGDDDAGGKDIQTPSGVVRLTARQLQYCAEAGAKPEVYAANMAVHLAAKGDAASEE